MAVVRFLHILSVVSLVILHASFDALPVNALALEHGHVARGHVHADIAKRRDSSPTCRPRPTSASPKAVTPTPSVPPSSASSQPASSTTSSQAPAANTPSSPSGSKSKILMPWNNPELGAIENFTTSYTKTLFNWQLEAAPASYLGSGAAQYASMEFVPSIADAAGAKSLKDKIAGKHPLHIRGFNEPEIDTQAAISVSDAYNLWVDYVLPAVAGLDVQLMAPAVTTGPSGTQWITDFMKMCNGKCRISLMDFHFYVIEPSEIIPVVTSLHQQFGLNIWITECGCMDYSGKNRYCTQEIFNTLYSAVMPFVMNTEWIEKIGWFGMFTAGQLPNNVNPANAMIVCDDNGCRPNALGKVYINAGTTYPPTH